MWHALEFQLCARQENRSVKTLWVLLRLARSSSMGIAFL